MCDLDMKNVLCARQLCAHVEQTPTLVHSTELSFLKKFLLNFEIPDEEEEQVPGFFDEMGSDELYAQAMLHVKQGEHKLALSAFEQFMKLSTYQTSRNYAMQAELEFKLKNYDNARKSATHALVQNPNSTKALRTRGLINTELRDWKAARADLTLAQEIDFDSSLVQVHEQSILESSKLIRSESLTEKVSSSPLSPDLMSGIQDIMNNPQFINEIMSNPALQSMAQSLVQKNTG